jgi:hypothetical protein
MIATEWVKGKARVRPAKAAAEGKSTPRTRAAKKRAPAKRSRG